LRENRERLVALGVVHAWLFGSVARDAATSESDIDVMVDLDEGPTGRKPLFSAFEVGGIRTELTEIFGRPVVSSCAATPCGPVGGFGLRRKANCSMPSKKPGKVALAMKMIAGFRNALAHTYDDILDERVMLTIRDDLPALDAALARILDAK
jgi:predicted nucleotidyltransferase